MRAAISPNGLSSMLTSTIDGAGARGELDDLPRQVGLRRGAGDDEQRGLRARAGARCRGGSAARRSSRRTTARAGAPAAAARADQQRALGPGTVVALGERRRPPSGIGQRSGVQSAAQRMSEMSPWIGNVCASGLPARRCRPSTFWVTSAKRSRQRRARAARARWAAFGLGARGTPRGGRGTRPTPPTASPRTPRASRAPAGGTRARRRSSSPPCRGTSGCRSRRRRRRR